MINLTKLNDSIKFTFNQSDHYLFNGEIEAPLNSLALVIDESDMVTFKKASSNDIFISANVSEFNMDKAALKQWFVTNAMDSGISEEEVEEAINTALSYYYDMDEVDDLIDDFFDGVEYDSTNSRINFKHGTTVKGYIDATPFIVDGMVSNVEISNGYLVITFNTDSGKQPIQIPLTDIFNPDDYYTKTDVNTLLANKQDTLVAGSGITIENNVISAEGGGKAINAGTNISVTTGETADTINCTLNLENGTNSQSGGIILKSYAATNRVSGRDACAFGGGNKVGGTNAFVTGYYNTGDTSSAFISGYRNETTNDTEVLFGMCALSNGQNSQFNGNSGCTLFAVGNGEGMSETRHNAFEIRQNGDIYIVDTNDTSTTNWYQKPMIKLQDALGGGSSYTAGDGIDITNDVISVTGKVDTTAFTAHTADTVIHVTSAEKTAWNAKSDFSGDYNDLTNKPTIPTVPTSNTAFTNDAGYITSDAISGKADTSAVTESINAAVSGKVDTTTYNTYTAATDTAIAGKQDTLVSGTNIKTINNESILGSGNITIEGGGGKAVSAGTNISITTGETADTINCTLPYYNIDNNPNYPNYSIYGRTNSTNTVYDASRSLFIGNDNEVTGDSAGRRYYNNCVIGDYNKIKAHITDYLKGYNVVIGDHNTLSGTDLSYSYVIGKNNSGYTSNTLLTGWYNQAYNGYESVLGKYNVSNTGSTDADKSLFSVGNGTSNSARHNAFEIRQNGDIYCSDGTNDVKLQDTIAATAANTTALGGLKLVKLTQAEYDALSTKDSQTLYIVTDS